MKNINNSKYFSLFYKIFNKLKIYLRVFNLKQKINI